MSRIVLPWTDIKSYSARIGPGVGRPPRPAACVQCPGTRIWYDGWRYVFCVVLAENGRAERVDGGVPLQRVACAACWKSWTLWPSFLYPARQFGPDVNEAAALAYLANANATYARVGARYGCAWTSVWRWVGWLGRLAAPEESLGAVMRTVGDSPALDFVPREVPQDHEKAYSPKRAELLLRAYRTLVLICLLARTLWVPPSDPSPLRWFLWTWRQSPRHPTRRDEEAQSPAFHIDRRGPPDA